MIRIHARQIISLVAFLVCSVLLIQAQAGKPAAPSKTPGKAAISGSAAPTTKTATGATAQADLAATDLKAVKKPPLPEFHPQQPKRIQLENGMVIFLQEDHELPLISGTAYIRGGSSEEPAEKIGQVSIYGTSWRTGGTKSKTGDQLDDALEARAAR